MNEYYKKKIEEYIPKLVFLENSDSDSEQEWSLENIEEVFKISKKKLFSSGDQSRLLDCNKVKNIYGDNVLQSYIKGQQCSISLLNKFIKEDHDINNINNEGDSIIYSCILYSHSKLPQRYKKINWLLDNNSPINIPKYNITKFFLFDFPCKSSSHTYGTPFYIKNPPKLALFSGYYFDLIQRLFDMNLFETDLTEKYPYITIGFLSFHAISLNQIIWFDKNFKLNTEYHVSPNEFYNKCFGNPVYYSSIYGIQNRDVLIYLIKKNPDYLINAVNKLNIFDQILRHKGSVMLSLIEYYIKDEVDTNLEKISWKYFIERCSTTFYYGSDRLFKKENIIFGLKYKKIFNFPINIIKGLRLTLDDFNGDIYNSNTGIVWTDGIHPDLLFPEDHPNISDKIIKANKQSHDLEKFTKEFCIKEYKKIMKYINKYDFSVSEFPGQPFNSYINTI